jgi:hypothetical protein
LGFSNSKFTVSHTQPNHAVIVAVFIVAKTFDVLDSISYVRKTFCAEIEIAEPRHKIHALENNLSPDEQEAIALARVATDELPITVEELQSQFRSQYRGYLPLRREAMLLSSSKRPAGRRYSASFHLLLTKAGLIKPNDQPANDYFGNILYIYDDKPDPDLQMTNAKILEKILGDMTPSHRLKLITPDAMRKRIRAYKKEQAVPRNGGKALKNASAAQEKRKAEADAAAVKDTRILELEKLVRAQKGS